jgi:hypothetical protein
MIITVSPDVETQSEIAIPPSTLHCEFLLQVEQVGDTPFQI